MARRTRKSGKDGEDGGAPADAAADDQVTPPAAEDQRGGADGTVPSGEAAEDEPTPQKKELSEIADQLSEREAPYALSKVEHVLWRGEKLSRAWVLCKKDDCGYKGATQNARFGRWFDEAKFAAHLPQRTAHNSRITYEKFGHLGAEVIERIGVSNCYKLASDDMDEWTRNAVIERAQAGERFTVKSMQAIRKQVDRADTPRERNEVAAEQNEVAAEGIDRREVAETISEIYVKSLKLPDDAARYQAVIRIGISFSTIVGEMVKHTDPNEAAKEIAEAITACGLWDLIRAADPGPGAPPQPQS